jgi:hypothetical protein
MKLRHFTLITLASLVAGPSMAAEPTFRVVMPAETTLSLAGPDIPESPYQWAIGLEGQVSIHAKYRFIYDDESGAEQPMLLLLPDQDSILRLPHVVRPGTGWVPERAEAIRVFNVREAALALLPDKFATRILAGEIREVEGEAVILGEEFHAGYECDAPLFSVRFVKVDREVLHARLGASGPPPGC